MVDAKVTAQCTVTLIRIAVELDVLRDETPEGLQQAAEAGRA